MLLDDTLANLIDRLVGGFDRTPVTVRLTGRRAITLPPDVPRDRAEAMLTRLLVNVDLLEAYDDALLAAFYTGIRAIDGLKGEPQVNSSLDAMRMPVAAVLEHGLARLSDAEVAAFLMDVSENRRVHELLAEAHANGEQSDHWAAVLGALDPAAIKWTNEFVMLK